MLEQLKAKSTQAAAMAMDTAGSIKDVAQKSTIASSLKDATQKGSAALQAKAGALNIKVPTVVKSSSSSSSLASGADTANESDLEGGKSPSNANQEKEGLLNELGQECGLTKRQRLYGAVGCYLFGSLCGFLSTLMMWGGPKHLKQFAFFYTLGTLCSIGSSLFLIGPMRQLKVMCMPVRRVACCIWIGAMFTTLIIAFGFPKAGPLVLFLVIIQYSAMLWYGASFIPYGRAILRKGCTKAASYVSS
ncbi:Vesicle transport protein SFT2B [Phytophthora citrophthora]|uniref:Vesicle transport protein n=1 Tax=Phytophthora citrophthora TaxID=4793 RepID=A0AAD9G132_9STRA|nr:Vesicle transport protein SFT2B [Phytophthora citrophthora]